MCDPISLTIAAGVTSAVSSIAGGMMQQKIANSNAAALEEQARLRKEKAEFDARTAETRYDRTAGKARAAAGTTGLDLATFSDVFQDSAAESQLEIAAIRYGGAVDAANYQTQANIKRQEGKAAMVGGILGGIGNIFSAGGKAASFGGSSPQPSYSWSPTVYRG